MAAEAAEVAKSTVGVWIGRCRKVCNDIELALLKMVDTNDAFIEVDESYSSGWRKFNRVHLRIRNRPSLNQEEERSEIEF